MRGIRPLAFWLCLFWGSCFGWFLFAFWGLLVFFSPSSCCVSFPFNDDLGTPPTRRPYSWKKKNADWRCNFRPLVRQACQGSDPCSLLGHFRWGHIVCISRRKEHLQEDVKLPITVVAVEYAAFQGCFALTTAEMPGCVALGVTFLRMLCP